MRFNDWDSMTSIRGTSRRDMVGEGSIDVEERRGDDKGDEDNDRRERERGHAQKQREREEERKRGQRSQ